ncbi:glutamine amidotransferase [Cryobacterium sp. TMT2-18-3]|uniref:glutamine amidotransferase n=1 Tax=unclassified Cryobacterium TaxID=2649013 RepID=UPI00106D09B6|nr:MULTISPECIES: glutamine amidotransferase [unclassified Cryobacterium]TFC27083.1 glutamine amidotransferase [Cryobacterium sp. TMT2-18-2]TFC39993.1 glutamine amidotransferase [Cryobacterium sp. TMT2-42-4]TFC55463.1 glutamine amidotransferase [Cryobacterium sp. TMT2-15-1]TFC63518.1 glutamine amidotransferase [Cryobacterium sp. TMT2-18-3]
MTRTAVVLRHDDTIHLGNLEPVLREHGYSIRYVDTLREDVRALDPREADLLVVLGGEMGVYEADEFPTLHAEIELLTQRLGASLPVFGVCLGAQLMANALGSRVYRGPTNEIGYRSVEPTEAGATSPLRHVSGVPVFQWHSDTFDLPDGVTRLAGSPQYGNEAFGIGDWALAVQFHPEVTEEMHEVWLEASEAEVSAEGFDVGDLRRERERYSNGMQSASRSMFSEWLDGLGPRRTP